MTTTDDTYQADIDHLIAQFRNHRCSEATRVMDAYCPCQGAAEEIYRLQINIDHLHGKGLDGVDDYRFGYLFAAEFPSRWAWEDAQRAQRAAAVFGDDEPPF